MTTRQVGVLLLAAAMAATAGCALWNRVQNTQITVQFSTDEVLHIAPIPRALPNGERPVRQVRELLELMVREAGGYTYIEEVVGGWLPPGQQGPVQEVNDLLLVKGRAELAAMIYQRLKEDFGQDKPFVISVPVLPTRVPAAQAAPQPATAAQDSAARAR